MKTNKEIMKELETRGWKSPEQVNKFFLKCLEDKDKQMREIVESVPMPVCDCKNMYGKCVKCLEKVIIKSWQNISLN